MKQHIIIILLLLCFLFGCDVKVSPNNTSKEEIEKNVKSRIAENTNSNTDKESSDRIKYTVVKSWSIPNGGKGKLILVNRDLFNEADMRSLGDKLKKDALNDRNSIVFVYDDMKAVNMRDRYMNMKTSSEEDKFYESHLLAQYNKNGNTEYHEYKIYLWGFMNDKFITVSY